MKRLATALAALMLLAACILAAFVAMPANAADASATCKVTDARYIHAGQVGPDWWAYWWCDDGSFEWTTYIGAALNDDRIKAGVGYYKGLNDGSAGALPGDDPRVRPLWEAAKSAMDADTDRPKPLAWAVAPNGKYPDRPTYPVADGKRGTKSDGRAKVGAACDCTAPIVEGKTTYCPVPPSASVAVCVRAP